MANNIIKKVSVNGTEYDNDNPDNYLDIYTLEERKIGTWLGEDLYRKVIPYSYTTANNGTIRMDVTSLNIKTLIRANALLTNLEHEPAIQIVYPNATSDNSQGGLWYSKRGAYPEYPNSDLINLHFGSQYSGYSASGHIIIEYTKNS